MSVPSIDLPLAGWSMRAWSEDDMEALATLGNDERIAAWMSDAWPMPYTEQDAQWWVREGQFSTGRVWALCLRDQPHGGVALHPQQGFQRCNVEVGWWLNPACWGQGVGPAAARVVLEQAFANPEVTRVFAPIHGGNIRSMRVAEKIGMRLESVQPRSAFKRGKVIDRHLFAVYRD